MRSDAGTVDAYLDALTPERRGLIEPVRDLVAANLPKGYVESMTWGMPTYEIPLERYPDTYNGKPLGYVALAAQKNHGSLYLMALYSDTPLEQSFRERWTAPSGRALDLGKSCVRFKKLEDLDLPLVAETVAAVTVERFLEVYERIQRSGT